MRPDPPSILLTRPLRQAQRFAGELRGILGPDVPIILSPVLQIIRSDPPADISAYRYLAFTSENGVWAVADQARPDQIAFCVGQRTAKAAEKAGFDSRSADGDGMDLAMMIRRFQPDAAVLHIHGAELRVNLAQVLAETDCQIDQVLAYDQVPCELTEEAGQLLKTGEKVILPLFSPRSARLLARSAGLIRAELSVVALSQAVAEAAKLLNPVQTVISGVATGPAMLKSIESLLNS